MPSVHIAPYCCGKVKQSQDELKHNPLKCPNCGIFISNEDVRDCVELQDCVSLITVDKKSQIGAGLFIE